MSTQGPAPRRTPTAAQAEREWYLADTENVRAELRKFEVETQVLEEQLREARRDNARHEAYAASRRVFDFVGEVTEYTVKTAVDELNDWAAMSSEPITIRLNSPGGNVMDGFMMYDFVQDLRRGGLHVTTYCIGYAASMASVLLQAGDHRRISRNSWFMVHEPSTIAFGKASEMRDESKLVDRLHKQLLGILSERSTLSAAQIRRRCERKDWWMTADEAVQLGFADELV